MTIKCEEVIIEEGKPSQPASQPSSGKHTFVCTKCGNEAEMLVDL